MTKCAWANFRQLLLHLARKPADRRVTKPLRYGPLLGFFQAINGALLLLEIAFVFDLGFNGFQFVAEGRRERTVIFR